MANTVLQTLHLYTSPFSGSSARIRIAAHLKSIPLTYHNIDLSTSQQTSPNYLTVNPNGSVPALIIEFPRNRQVDVSPEKYTITQSAAIIDFLETHFPNPPLLPGVERWKERARVVELTSLVACDIQPPQSSRIRKKIASDFGGDGEVWAKYVYERGLGTYETFLERARLKGEGVGRYSVGDKITLADIFLVPAVQVGLKVGIELEKWPLVKSVVDECWKLEAFRKGGVGGHQKLAL